MNLIFPLKKNIANKEGLKIDKKTLLNTKLGMHSDKIQNSIFFNNNVEIFLQNNKIEKHIKWDLIKNETILTYSNEEYDRSIDHNQILVNRIKKAQNRLYDDDIFDEIRANMIHRPATVMHEFSFQR
jgi:hypothetical protein